MVTVEELRKCKKADAELIQAVKNRINEICSDYDECNHIEDEFGFENRGVCYDVKEGEESLVYHVYGNNSRKNLGKSGSFLCGCT